MTDLNNKGNRGATGAQRREGAKLEARQMEEGGQKRFWEGNYV